MQKLLIQWSLIGSAVFMLLSFNVDALLVRFLLIGEVPGSANSLSPTTMLSLYGISLGLTLIYLLVPRSQISELSKRAQTFKSRLPRKRFSSL